MIAKFFFARASRLNVRLTVSRDRGRIRVRERDMSRVRDRVKNMDRVRVRDCRSEPDCRSEAINFGAKSDCRSEPNTVHNKYLH